MLHRVQLGPLYTDCGPNNKRRSGTHIQVEVYEYKLLYDALLVK
jgi:hypothetical protein